MLPYHHSSQIRVRYVETDRMGVVWHGNYLQYFEAARSEAMRAAGIGSYADLEAAGVMMPVVDVTLHYIKPAVYDDLLTIHVYIEEPLTACMKFRYEIDNPAGEHLVTGTTTLAFMRASDHHPCRPPPFMREFFK